MYMEIRASERDVVLDAITRQMESGRAAQVTLGKDGWLFTMSLVTGETDGSAPATGIT